MSGIEKVSISLTPEMAALINAAVLSGEYASQSEVIREALRDWRQHKHVRLEHADELYRLAMEGVNSGPGKLGGIDAIKKEARRRYMKKNPS